jgi:sugar lactone lactonase YvrE
MRVTGLLGAVACGVLASWLAHAAPASVQLPGGERGIGFDDLRFDAGLRQVLAPAGGTGNLDLVDPKTGAITPIAGFSRTAGGGDGHGHGVTSVDSGEGWLFATDRTAREILVIDPRARKIVAGAGLASGPDYVRYVAATRELWVTQPGEDHIEVFTLSADKPPKPKHAAFISIRGGPESLVIDGKRGRAYTHRWKRDTLAVDLRTRRIVATWAAGCAAPRGIALDEPRGFLLVGCEAGEATVLDVDHDGKLLSTVKSVRGVDIIAYDPARRHLYLPGEDSATMAILGVSDRGVLTVLGTLPTVAGAHCATTDGAGLVYVCDPAHGRLLVLRDPHPP